MNNIDVKSVYIHIPFCKEICTYCNFSKIYYQEDLVSLYLDALDKEIKEFIWDNKITTLYVGGGTPSSLSISNLEKLFKILNKFKLDNYYEFTFECNISDIREELLLLLKKNKVNRLSIGVQSFNKDKLQTLGREADFKDVKSKIKLARDLGFNNINLDLMYAVKGESISNLRKDLNQFIKLNPEHISTYSLIIEDNTILKKENIKPIDDDLDYKMYKTIVKTLKNNGYNHYELSNFSKPNYESKHNMVYWNNEEYYGFGLSAAGYFSGVRYENTKNITKYLEKEFISEKNILSKQEIMDYHLMLGFRKTKGINLLDFEYKYNVKLEDEYNIDNLLKSKDLIIKEGYIYINPKKMYLMNEILLKLM